MKKLLQILVAPLLVTAAFVATTTTVAFAATESCGDVVISNTGEGSVNKVECANNTELTITCKNGTEFTIDLDQEAESGDANNEGNTNGGDAQSGDADNQSNVDAMIENICGTSEEETPETPEVPTPTEPTTPEEGEVAGEAVAVLPETGSATTLQIVTLVAGALMATILAGRLTIAAYARGQK